MGTGVSTCTSCITDEAMNSDTEDYCTATRFLPEEVQWVWNWIHLLILERVFINSWSTFQVWTRIFLFLPFSDRKNANLVCRQWYDASNNIAILQHEKMIIRNMYSAPEILDMLTSSKRRFMNLDFHDIWFDDHLSSLWDACGFKIMSINFFNCVLDDENFLKAIETCENLTHLSWYYRNIGTLVPAEVKLCSDVVLRSLVEKKIIRKKLLSLRMCLDDISRIEKYTVPMMIMVFTHARKFALNFNKSDVNFHKEATESGDEITSYTILDKLVSLSDVITEVDLLLPASNNQIYSGFTCDSPEPIADLLLRLVYWLWCRIMREFDEKVSHISYKK